jgi:hypothetical protein
MLANTSIPRYGSLDKLSLLRVGNWARISSRGGNWAKISLFLSGKPDKAYLFRLGNLDKPSFSRFGNFAKMSFRFGSLANLSSLEGSFDKLSLFRSGSPDSA